MSVLAPSRDARITARIAAGDADAWDELDRRFRRPLRRYVATLAPPGAIDAEEVVQETLVKAFQRLRDGQPLEHLSAWLYRVARNAAIDALRAHGRHGSPADEVAEAPDPHDGPERLILRRERLRRLVEDIADLPDGQREALLARVVDGRSVAEVSRDLGLSAGAVHMTVRRARANLVRAQEARDAPCIEVRERLLVASDRGVRPDEAARLHLKSCPDCRSYRRDLRRLDRRLHGLAVPGASLLAGALLGGGGGIGIKVAAGTTAAVVAVGVVGGALLVTGEHRSRTGDPSPLTLLGTSDLFGQNLHAGQRLPKRTEVITATATLRPPRPAGPRPTVTLTCPAGMRVAGGSSRSPTGSRTGWSLSEDSWGALSRRGRFLLYGPWPKVTQVSRLNLICRTPDRNGSLVRRPRQTRPGERPAHVCRGSHYLHRKPHSVFTGTAFGGQPVSVVRTSHDWSEIVTDNGIRGWIETRALC